MIRMIAALAAASLMVLSTLGFSGETPYTAQPKIEKPGRAVTENAATNKKTARAIEDTVKEGQVEDHPARAIDKQKPAKKKSKQAKP